MLVRLQLLKMARESLPGADIDTVIEAAEKFAAFVEDDGGPTVESERVSRPLDTIVHTRADGASFQDLKKSFDDDPSPAADEPTAQVIEVPPEPAPKKHRSSLTRFPAHELKDPADLRRMKSNAAAAQKKPANPSVAEARRLNLTEKQSVFYAALKKRLESGERFILKDVAKDIGTGTENAYATGTALHRKGFIRVTRHGGGKPSTYAILKDENGEKLARPLVSAAPAPPERPTERPAAKPAPRPAPTIPPKAPKPAHKPAVSPVNKHLVRAPRPVSLNAPAPKKTEAPAYDESMVRRFEPKSREMMIREALEGQGYVVKSAGSDNWGKAYFYVDDKKMEADKAIELADEIRVAKGLEPIGHQQQGAE